MAYQETTVSAITDIPAVIAAFASARGWGVSSTTITRPGGGRSFNITASIGGTNNREHRLFVTDASDSARQVYTQLPWLNGTSGNPDVQLPTKVHLFGNDAAGSPAVYDPEPFIVCVIECGYNLYRHVYIGNLVKQGNYTGGELISANMFNPQSSFVSSSGSISYNGDPPTNVDHRYMFSARFVNSIFGSAINGGANIVHADNANPWRIFYEYRGLTDNAISALAGVEIFGGNADNINGGLVYRGFADYSGANILVPVNLFVSDSTYFGSGGKVRPVGYAAGARLVNMKNLTPGEAIDVGGVTWRVFPEFSKNLSTSSPYRGSNPSGGYYYPYETSYFLGLAYCQE
jgi:hypothetical protein